MRTRCVTIWENGDANFTYCEDLYDYQDIVSGLITGVYSPLLPVGTTIYANDEGLLLGMEYNTVASLVTGTHLVGPVVFAGPPDDEGDTTNITQEVIDVILKYTNPITGA